MDLTTWIVEELDDMTSRLESSVIGIVPVERHKERVDGGGSTITSLLWHLARHQDIAVNRVIADRGEILDDHRSSTGATGLAAAAGLEEAESQEITDQLDPDGVVEYYRAVCAATASLLPDLTADQLNAVPDSSARLAAAGVAESEVPWLYRMWDGKPASFHIRWEAIGHGVTHTGEMVSMRNRMGLSPF